MPSASAQRPAESQPQVRDDSADSGAKRACWSESEHGVQETEDVRYAPRVLAPSPARVAPPSKRDAGWHR